MKTIGVLTSGGDAPGMNAAIRSVVRTAASLGMKIKGIRRGYNGLIENDIFDMDIRSVSDIIQRGGTILYTARSPRFKTEEGMQEAIRNCIANEIEGIVVIGGDGSYRGLSELTKRGVNGVGIPATIDLDMCGTEYTIGFDTAVNTGMDALNKLRDTSNSHERCSVVEVMGRNAGFLAMYVGLAVGATAVLVPEKPIDFHEDVIEKLRNARLRGFTHYMIVVAEGAGSANEIAAKIKEAIDLDPRVTILGHIQRGGVPTGRDRVNATKMGYLAVKLLGEGKTNRIVCTHDGGFIDIDMDEGLATKKSMQLMEVEVLSAMTGLGH